MLKIKGGLMRYMRFILVAIAIVVLFASCEKKVSRLPETGEAGGEIAVGIIGEPENLTPFYPSFIYHNEITDMLFMPLHKKDVNDKIVPMLATSWEYSEDLKKITYNLRHDVVWQDQTPVTAYDVEYTFKMMKDPANNYPLIMKLQNIDSAKAISETRIIFFFNKVYPMALFDSDIKALPKHILEKEKNLANAAFNRKPVGNGPYKLDKWEAGKFISLVKNENYSLEDKPLIEKIVYMIYSDQAVMVEDIKQGKIDIAYDISPERIGELGKLKNVTPINKKGNTYTYLGFNTSRKPFDSKDFRKGISMLIDRNLLIKNTLQGNGISANGPITPSFWAYSENVKPVAFNKTDGEKLINTILKKDAKRYTYNAKPYTLNIITDRNDATMVNVAKEIALQLTNAGLSVKVTDLPSDSLIIKLFTRDYDLYVLSWQVSEDFNPFPFWSSKKEIGRFNFVDYYNANVDSIVNLAMTTMDKDEAFGYWEEFQKIIAEDQPYAFLYVPNRIIIVNNTIKSFDNVYTSSIEPISNLDIFYVEKTAQKKIDMAMLINPVEKVEEKKEETAKKTENKTEVKKTETKKEEVKTTPAPTAAQLLSQQVSSQQADTVKKEEEKKTAIIVQPAPVKIIQPSYPEAAKKIGAEGTVYVEAIVGKDGKVVSAKVIKSLNSVCDEAAVNAAMQAVFKPGTSDGVPTEMKTTIPYRFKP
ncbi:TPA: hypothetical protein DCW38_06650 [candidate division WOR-3 bacterium]|uniref:TonB C-terminal domain-containing protein n=1 Tax=candidate division WOR-3 bacterium TaxID=2052148 RepID=A0A350HBC6_UNCW3|nr:hypothetical protein [candidate division WOR-3 bacterium]